jgi:hypothetical protein
VAAGHTARHVVHRGRGDRLDAAVRGGCGERHAAQAADGLRADPLAVDDLLQTEEVDGRAVVLRRYGIEVAGDLYVPKNARGKLPALVVSGPFGAVKEQSSGLYANEFARRFLNRTDVRLTFLSSAKV